jgi:hypothetical protein
MTAPAYSPRPVNGRPRDLNAEELELRICISAKHEPIAMYRLLFSHESYRETVVRALELLAREDDHLCCTQEGIDQLKASAPPASPPHKKSMAARARRISLPTSAPLAPSAIHAASLPAETSNPPSPIPLPVTQQVTSAAPAGPKPQPVPFGGSGLDFD